MRINCCRYLPILVFSGLLTAFQSAQAAPAQSTTLEAADPYSTYPQIVRLSYVEGDVRVSRGALADKDQSKDGSKATGWEQAEANVPIESGYSLVTGKGRAEIEFEDASTVYLADNSVLSFTELSTTGGVPYTEIALIAGTATMNVHTMVQGESFKLTTPTDNISLSYPRRAVWRIDSYLDAVSITPLQDLTVRQPGMTAPQAKVVGKTQTFNNGHLVATPVAMDKAASSGWDMWVADRLEARNLAMSTAMKDARLTVPIPGLAELNGQGKFFACAPYGTCWEPAKGWDGKATDVALVESKPETNAGAQSAQSAAAVQAPPSSGSKGAAKSKKSAQTAADAYLASNPGATLWTEDYMFPCSTFGTRDLIGKDPVTGKEKVIWSEFDTDGPLFLAGYPYGMGYPIGMGNPYRAGYGRWGISPFWGFDAFNGYYPWDWAVCHSGSWIRWHHHYAWVAGTNRHHVPPVRWVQGQRTIGFVPIHPWDRAGKQPGNLKDGIFRLTHKGESIKRVVADDGKPVKLLNEPPKAFRKPILEPLKIAEVPRPEGHSAFNSNRAVATGGSGAARVPAVVNGSTIARGTAVVGSTTDKGVTPGKGFAAKEPGTPIIFDRRSQSFSLERPVIQGGRPTTVTEPIGGRGGNYQGGGNSSSAARSSNSGGYSNGGGSSRSSSPSPSYNGGGGSRSSSPAPSYNGGGGSRPSAPAPSYNGGGGGGGYSRPSAPPPPPPPPPPSAPPPSAPPPSAPAPSFSGGGGAAPSSGASPHK